MISARTCGDLWCWKIKFTGKLSSWCKKHVVGYLHWHESTYHCGFKRQASILKDAFAVNSCGTSHADSLFVDPLIKKIFKYSVYLHRVLGKSVESLKRIREVDYTKAFAAKKINLKHHHCMPSFIGQMLMKCMDAFFCWVEDLQFFSYKFIQVHISHVFFLCFFWLRDLTIDPNSRCFSWVYNLPKLPRLKTDEFGRK